MKRILGIAMVLGLVGALTVMAQEVKPGKAEVKGKSGKAQVKMNPGKVEVIDLGKDITLEMVLIPAGKFMMGSKKNPVDPFSNIKVEQPPENELPNHEVTLTKPFYIGKYEVTQEQWFEIMGKNPSETKGRKLPVTDVSWEDCQEFIKKLNASTKGGYRLPTEAEFEYACRAGTTTAYSFGDSLTKTDANIDGASVKAVGGYKPNAFGLYDMHGNVWEWCEDWFRDYPTTAVTDPKGAAAGKDRVLRGGSFTVTESFARSSFRTSNAPSDRHLTIGFRLARTADVKAAVAPPEPKPDPAEVMPDTGNVLVAPFSEAKAKEVQKSVAKSLQKEVEEKAHLGEGIRLDLVLIPAGKFLMGSKKIPVDPFSNIEVKQPPKNELPNHEVTLTKPFYIGKYEVTQEQWFEIMGENPSRNKGRKLPVTGVSWEECQELIKRLNAKTNGGYRLPTEAEWEYACRAGTTTAYSFGDEITIEDANYRESNIVKHVEVGSYKANAFGLYDMHGNVLEWCEDWYEDYPAGAVIDPKGPAKGYGRVLRGGSVSRPSSEARSSYRSSITPTDRSGYVGAFFGFRLVRTADIKVGAVPTVTKPDPTVVIPAKGNLLVAPFIETKAKEAQKEVAKSLKRKVEEKEDLGKDVKLEMVLVPAGKFKMGSPASDEIKLSDKVYLYQGDQGKQHEVTLTKPYYMGKYEVTQEQWQAVMEKNPSRHKGAKLPVTDVSWIDCQDFIKRLNAKTNGGYRLPTEAEWEYACRAGTSTAYSFGDKITRDDANVFWRTGTIVVGSFKPNAFGLYDMHGNVSEWCEDWYGAYSAGAVTDPKRAVNGSARVLRGGSFGNNFEYGARSSIRYSDTPTFRDYHNGFRLARTP